MTDLFYKSNNITMCNDGKYRWVYELDMYKSSVIIKEVWRAMGIAIVIVLAILFAINIMDSDLMETLQFIAQAACILFGILLVLSIIGYLIFAYMIGGKYCVMFEMDESGINHKQHEKHVKKAQLIGAISALGGVAGGHLGAAGTGVLAAVRTSMYSSFNDVKEIEILTKEHLIRLNETLSRNQVYADDEDFAFVANYIKARCRNAKVKGEAFADAAPRKPEAENQRTTQKHEAEQKRTMQVQNAAPKFCSNCGAKLSSGSKFCANCGEKV